MKQKNTAVFYTDEAYDEKSKISAASVVLYQNFKILSKSWNLEVEMNITDVEIYVIEKATECVNNLMQFSSNIWFFIDSQKSIKLIENSKHMLIDQTHQNLIKNQTNDIISHIHWISGHANIPNNEKANQLIKLSLNINVINSNRFLSFDFIKNQIIKLNQNEWKLLWTKNSKKGKRYQKFDTRTRQYSGQRKSGSTGQTNVEY